MESRWEIDEKRMEREAERMEMKGGTMNKIDRAREIFKMLESRNKSRNVDEVLRVVRVEQRLAEIVVRC